MMRKLSIILVFVLISALCFSIPVFAEGGSANNSKTFSGYSSDFGTKFWFVKTFINYNKTGSILNWTDVNAYNNSPLPPEMGNGSYSMARLVTYIGASSQTFYSLGSTHTSYIWPSGKYWYIAGGITQNLYGSGSETGHFSFYISGWQPLSDWANSLSINF